MASGWRSRATASAGCTLLALLIAGQLVGCADSRAPEAVSTPAGTTDAAAPIAVDAGSSANPQTSPVADAGRSSHVPIGCRRDGFPQLAAGCPPAIPSQFAPSCPSEGSFCRYLVGDAATGDDNVVDLACKMEEGHADWSLSSAPCRHTCGAPAAGAPLRVVDSSTCAERPLTPCGVGVTEQEQLDNMLEVIMRAPDTVRLDLSEDTLIVDFENGCPTLMHTALRNSLAGVEPLLAKLSEVRWACGVSFRCAEFKGPSTILAL